MKQNSACNLEEYIKLTNGTGHFIRKGITGDYKNIMTQDMITKFEEWIKKNNINLIYE